MPSTSFVYFYEQSSVREALTRVLNVVISSSWTISFRDNSLWYPLGSKMDWDCFEVGNMYLTPLGSLKQRAVPVGGKSQIHRKPQHFDLVKVGFNPLLYVMCAFFSRKWGWSHQTQFLPPTLHSQCLSRVHVGRFRSGSAMTGLHGISY